MILAIGLPLALCARPGFAMMDSYYHITFDLNERQEEVAAFVAGLYADYIEEITANTDVPLRLGIAIHSRASPDAQERLDADMNKESIWAMFDHPNACTEEGRRLVHLYRDWDDDTNDFTGPWTEGLSVIASGEMIRFYHFGNDQSPYGCIQMRNSTLYLYWDERQEIRPGRSC